MKYLLLFVQFFVYVKNVNAQKILLKPESVQSVYLEFYENDSSFVSATGFFIKSKTQYYLVTNYHCVTGINPYTNKREHDPAIKIKIYYHDKTLKNLIHRTESLIDKKAKKALWIGDEGINDNNKIEIADFVVLPLKDTSDVSIFPINYKESKILFDEMSLNPTDNIYVLGYPNGILRDGFPIWKSAIIASEPYMDQMGKPLIYIDGILFKGMSGSPVYYISNNYSYKEGGGKMSLGGEKVSIFIGIFSAYKEDSLTALPIYDVVWKLDCLVDMFNKLP